MKIEVEIPDEAVREFFGDPENYEDQYGDNVDAVIGEALTDMVLGNPPARHHRKALKFATNEHLDEDQQEAMAESATRKGEFLSDHMDITITDPDLQ